jgi:myosin protein heavy chain
VDPHELQAAVERIATLQQTNKVLIAQLDQQQADRKNLVEKVVAEEAQKALNEANRQLLDQRLSASRLQKEKTDIEGKLRTLQDGTVRKLETENSALKQQVVELKADTEKGKQVAELAGRLSRLQTQLDGVLKTNASLFAEKTALEKQLGDAQVRKAEESIVRIAKLETDVALARADAARNSTRADELALALVKEKDARTKLEQDNKTLEDRISKLGESGNANGEVVKTLQTALNTEKTERSRLETELRAAEDKLAELSRVQLTATRPPTNFGAVAITPALTIAPPDAATLAKIEGLEGDMRQLRVALKDSRDHETELKTALVEEETMRHKLEREKADLEKRLAAVPKTPGPDKSVASLESKVRELEKQRDDLTKKLVALNSKSQLRLAAAKPTLMTPRDHAADFRAQRQSAPQ